MSLICTLLAAIVVGKALAALPKGYVLKVSSNCGKSESDLAIVTIVADLDFKGTAVCAGNIAVPFERIDKATARLAVKYNSGGSSKCQFTKRDKVRVYVLHVKVAYGDNGNLVYKAEEERTITCTFDPTNKNETRGSLITAGLIAPGALSNYQGPAVTSNLKLQLTDVLGKDMVGRKVWRSRKVQLKGTTSGSSGEKGVKPVDCDAIGHSSGKRYAVIRAGCGDGIVFPKDRGFITEGLVTKSPFFESFGIENDTALNFQCNFTLCTKKCDGDSCTNQRRRRSNPFQDLEEPIHGDMHVKSEVHHLADIEPRHHMSRTDAIQVMVVDRRVQDSALYWSAILGLGLLVGTSFAISIASCIGPLRIRTVHNGKV
ncbi:vitelline envelope sperm lysin receptor-like [Haliotis rubra]|uniref:vitelline envelope sperm lysin receptor-like n=1 Tax=Haliotis rubra TaxID=36100 RepID=UPI001EE5979B|nr:vitelline envelope sperm lysin receptor-like [Haliotis rubra]